MLINMICGIQCLKIKDLWNQATSDGIIAYDFDFAKSGDYTLGTARDRVAGNIILMVIIHLDNKL